MAMRALPIRAFAFAPFGFRCLDRAVVLPLQFGQARVFDLSRIDRLAGALRQIARDRRGGLSLAALAGGCGFGLTKQIAIRRVLRQ